MLPYYNLLLRGLCFSTPLQARTCGTRWMACIARLRRTGECTLYGKMHAAHFSTQRTLSPASAKGARTQVVSVLLMKNASCDAGKYRRAACDGGDDCEGITTYDNRAG